jgi:dTDP-4-amino-4,6-dideoxygalactose transaminase
MAAYAPGAAGALRVTEELGATSLALPMGPSLTAEQVQEVVAAVTEVSGALARGPGRENVA